MKIIGLITGGFLIEATNQEVTDLQKSIGNKDPKPTIGDTIPCLDISSQMRQLREMSESSDMRYLFNHLEQLTAKLASFKKASEKFKL